MVAGPLTGKPVQGTRGQPGLICVDTACGWRLLSPAMMKIILVVRTHMGKAA